MPPIREDSLVERSPPLPTKKPTRRCQKNAVQNDEEQRCTAWKTNKESALYKAWVRVYEDSVIGNARKDVGYWNAILARMYTHCHITQRRAYDMINGKWKTLRPKVAQFCVVYGKVFRMAVSGAGYGYYTQQALLEYQAEYGTSFTLLHCWAELKDCVKWRDLEVQDFEEKKYEKSKRYKSSGSSSFNTSQSVHGGFNLNTQAGDDEDEEVQEVQYLMGKDRAKAQKKKGRRHWKVRDFSMRTCWLG